MTNKRSVKLSGGWLERLAPEFEKPYMEELRRFLLQEKQQGKTIFPPGPDIFRALNLTPFEKTKVVILGQDPYHGPRQAHGLSFSVLPGTPIPPSLINIYKELKDDLGMTPPSHGWLESWAKQGVLLLNAVLTVEQHRAASHSGRGWEEFTDKIVELLNLEKEALVFILWGAYAQKKGARIDQNRHLIIRSPHPSPLSASRGFFGSRPFSRTNDELRARNIHPIDWTLGEIRS